MHIYIQVHASIISVKRLTKTTTVCSSYCRNFNDQKYSLHPLPPNNWLCFYMVTGIAALFFSYPLYSYIAALTLMLSCLTEICIHSLHINKNEASSLNKPFNTWLTVDSCIITVTTSTVAVSKVKTVPQPDL